MSIGTYEIKASTYKPFPIVKSFIQFFTKKNENDSQNVVQNFADYNFKVTLPVPLEVLNPCYIKFVFPIDFLIDEAKLYKF